jgi:hypothetical protein
MIIHFHSFIPKIEYCTTEKDPGLLPPDLMTMSTDH